MQGTQKEYYMPRSAKRGGVNTQESKSASLSYHYNVSKYYMNVKSGNTTEKPLISHPTKLVDEPPEGRQTIIVDAVKVSKEDFKRGYLAHKEIYMLIRCLQMYSQMDNNAKKSNLAKKMLECIYRRCLSQRYDGKSSYDNPTNTANHNAKISWKHPEITLLIRGNLMEEINRLREKLKQYIYIRDKMLETVNLVDKEGTLWELKDEKDSLYRDIDDLVEDIAELTTIIYQLIGSSE